MPEIDRLVSQLQSFVGHVEDLGYLCLGVAISIMVCRVLWLMWAEASRVR